MAAIPQTPEIHEVVVIGSGAGGGTVAHFLTGLGLRVTLLEAGPMLDPYREFKEHQWPYDVDHRGANEGGSRYFDPNARSYFSTLSGGWELDGGGGSGIDAGAPEFIDLRCSQNDELADIYPGIFVLPAPDGPLSGISILPAGSGPLYTNTPLRTPDFFIARCAAPC